MSTNLSIQVGFCRLPCSCSSCLSPYDFILFLLPFYYLSGDVGQVAGRSQFQIDVSDNVSLCHLSSVYSEALEPLAMRQSHSSFYLLGFRSTELYDLTVSLPFILIRFLFFYDQCCTPRVIKASVAQTNAPITLLLCTVFVCSYHLKKQILIYEGRILQDCGLRRRYAGVSTYSAHCLGVSHLQPSFEYYI